MNSSTSLGKCLDIGDSKASRSVLGAGRVIFRDCSRGGDSPEPALRCRRRDLAHLYPLVTLGAEPKRQALRFTFGTNARNRRGLSFMICRSTSSLTPAFFSLGTKTVSVLA
jgi:hypothetical protein